MKRSQRNIILVHGSFHNGSCWDLLTPELRKLDFLPHVITLPGHEIKNKNKSAFRVDIKRYVLQVVQEIKTLNEPVVLLGHSMGGAIISMVGEQYPSLVAELIYLTAIVPRKRDRIIQMSAGLSQVQKSLFEKAIRFPLKKLLKARVDIHKEKAIIVFYGEQSDDVQKLAIKNIVPQPIMPLLGKIRWTEENLGRIRKSYIQCSLDKALPIVYQKAYQKYMKFSVIKTLESDHSPFFLLPATLANTILDVLE